jgi:hypothetical protein
MPDVLTISPKEASLSRTRAGDLERCLAWAFVERPAGAGA